MKYSLYFHIPFCTQKCGYCHFYVIPNQERFQALFMEALSLEWQRISARLPKQGKLVSIYFGGGTPSLLTRERLETILSWINPSEDVEVTLEANPETASLATGVNRVSIGVQALDDSLLSALTRTHSAHQAEQAVLNYAQSGIKNISIDLMYDIPGQTLASWEKTLERALRLPITHVSLYNLTLEPHTAFYKNRTRLKPTLPSDAVSLRMLQLAVEKLAAAGFERYEISAFSKPGYRSKHNLGYWTARPFFGLGPSAYSYWNGARFQNQPNLHRYAKQLKSQKSAIHFYEKLPDVEHLKEKLAIRLRFLDPLESWPSGFKNIYTCLSAEGFLNQETLTLSDKGILFHDSVASIIIND